MNASTNLWSWTKYRASVAFGSVPAASCRTKGSVVMLVQSPPASLRSHSVVVSAAANGAMRASTAACERCSLMVWELCVGSAAAALQRFVFALR